MTNSVFQSLAINAVPRAMALIDLDPMSPTYGCADRDFWCYRTVKDHPSAAHQAICLGLAHVYTLNTETGTNLWKGDVRLHTAALAAASYWAQSVHPNGAVDEWYRNEHSFCATAFTVAAVGQCLLVLGEQSASNSEWATIRSALIRSAAWLENRFNEEVMNQNLAAALGLWTVYRLTDDARWQNAAIQKWQAVASHQSSEGWLPEYGGMDIGYSTLALGLLAAADAMDASSIVNDIARPLSAFIARASAPDGTFPGRLGSRGTPHTFPGGMMYYGTKESDLADITRAWAFGFEKGTLNGPNAIDDRYFAYFYFPQFAAFASQPVSTKPTRLAAEASAYFEKCEWWRTSTPLMDVFVSGAMGCVVAIKEKSSTSYRYAMGYDIVDGRGIRFSSAVRATKNFSGPNQTNPPNLSCTVAFGKRSGLPPLTRLAVPFAMIIRVIGLLRLSEWFQRMIKRRFVHATNDTDYVLARTVTVLPDHVTIEDRIVSKAAKPKAIVPTRQISMHSPSARQDTADQETAPNIWDSGKAIHILASKNAIKVIWTYRVDHNGQLLETVTINE